MKKLKSWFRQIIAEEARRILSVFEVDLRGRIEAHVKNVFASEAAQCESRLATAKVDIQTTFADLKATEFASLDTEIKRIIRSRITDFEESVKDEPARWGADPETVASDTICVIPSRGGDEHSFNQQFGTGESICSAKLKQRLLDTATFSSQRHGLH
jgi:hypothetical protein